jgi:hypothetical protein
MAVEDPTIPEAVRRHVLTQLVRLRQRPCVLRQSTQRKQEERSMSQTSKSADDERLIGWTGDQALAEKGLQVKRKFKVVVLIAVLVLAMAALIYVNLQNVRDTGRRGLSSVSAGSTLEAGQLPSMLHRIVQRGLSDAS